MDSERIKEIKEALGKGGWGHLDDFPDNIIRGLLTHIDDVTKERDEARKERQELLEELAFQKEFFREMNDQRQGLIIRMMKAERLNKNLVENLSQTIQERDKAERELEARRQGRFYD